MNEELIKSLMKLLASWTVFYQKTHTYHWDFTGKNFLEVHAQFKSMYEDSVENSDTIAERLRQLGVKIKLNLKTAVSDSVITDENSPEKPEEIIRDTISSLAQLSLLQTEIMSMAEEQKDLVTHDCMIQLTKWAEMKSWFLTSIVTD